MSAPMGSSDELLRMGEEALAQSRWQDASELFKRSYDADPTRWQAIQGLSIALFQMGRREDAWVLAQESHRRSPDDEDNLANLRDIAQALGREDELGQILSGNPAADAVAPGPRETRSEDPCASGEALLSAERWNEALPRFLEALDRDASQPRAWGGIGISCFRQGWPTAARAFFEMAVRMDPADEDSVFNWIEAAPAGASDRDLAMTLESMGVERPLREKAIEARRR